MRRIPLMISVCVFCAALCTGGAAADGGPSPGIDTGSVGIAGPGGQLRYVAVPGQTGTVVEAIRTHGGQIRRWVPLRGLYGIPYVTNEGETGGLSRDGRTLVLASYATAPGQRSATHFVVVSVPSLRKRTIITLRGSYAYDALSPDARTLYLIQYASGRDYTRYRVRAYDLEQRRLLRGTIVDKREPNEVMAGWPVTRTASEDGRWVYTLYARRQGASFVHALDTVGRQAVCLDLELRVTEGVRLALSPGEKQLVLKQRNGIRLATISAPG
jgi:hypothetical protein